MQRTRRTTNQATTTVEAAIEGESLTDAPDDEPSSVEREATKTIDLAPDRNRNASA